MTLTIILLCIVGLVLLIAWGKFNPFLAFLVVSIAAGLALGIPLNKIARSVENGIADTMKSLITIIGLGAMLGKLVAESGAAQKITQVLMKTFGEKYLGWALMVTGFICRSRRAARNHGWSATGLQVRRARWAWVEARKAV